MDKKRAFFSVFTLLFIICAATGCLSISADDLYSLPEISEEYVRLQAQFNALLRGGAVFAAPARGLNRQPYQLNDLNSDGVNEVIAFFALPGESRLMIYIFKMEDNDYVVADVIESAGSAIDSVRYTDMNNDGNCELVIGWQMGSTLKYMSIYSIVNYHSQMIVSGEEYTEIAVYRAEELSGESIVIFKLSTQDPGSAAATIYSLMPDGEVVTGETRLSSGIESVSRIVTGNLADGVPALFVESEGRFENGNLVTDILAVREDGFNNISLQPAEGISTDTVRQRMNCAQIGGDGIVSVPALRRLIAQSETEYFAIDWYSYYSDGSRIFTLSTYHNIFDEWYLILPEDWRDKVSVRREDYVPGERTIIFSYFEYPDNPESGGFRDFLKIFKLTGDNAAITAREAGRVLLISEGIISYAFELLVPDDSFGLTINEAMVRDNFRLIRTDWQPG